MNKIYVIAGNYTQGLDWAKRNANSRYENGDTTITLSDYVIVTDPNKLRGIRDPHGVFVGTWRKNPDIQEIVHLLYINTTQRNHTLETIKNSL